MRDPPLHPIMRSKHMSSNWTRAIPDPDGRATMKAGSDYDGRIPVWDKVCKWRLYLTDGSVVKALAGKGIRGDVCVFMGLGFFRER